MKRKNKTNARPSESTYLAIMPGDNFVLKTVSDYGARLSHVPSSEGISTGTINQFSSTAVVKIISASTEYQRNIYTE